MQAEKDIFKIALEHHFCGVLILDKDLKIIYANQCAADFLKISTEHLLTLDIHRMLQDGLIHKSCSLEASRTKKPYSCTVNTRHCQSARFYSYPSLTADGEIEFIFTYGQSDFFCDQPQKQKRHQAKAPSSSVLTSPEPPDFPDQGLIAESAATKKVFCLAHQVASSDASVILHGESGTGKEVVANYIYRHSRRSQEAFIAVNCAAIPESLMESEFFGYEPGAFTGAHANGKAGLFEQANKGTLFLDEIGEMSLPLQSKFLRVLEDQHFRRLGGNQALQADVRIIAATNKDLRQMVKDKLFRNDLFYRLSIIPIEIPPLRHRREDILALSQLFLSRMNHTYESHKTLSQELITYILRYSWPGNIRELKNFIERLHVISPGDDLRLPSDTPPLDSPIDHAPRSPQITPPSTVFSSGQSLRDAVSDFERSYLSKVLEQCNYNISQAAKLLDMHRTSLYQKLQKYDIQRK